MSERSDDLSADVSAPGQIDSVCEAFEDAWLADPPAKIEVYMAGWSEPKRGELFRELVRIDLDFRLSRDQAGFSVNDYYDRFPDYSDDIDTAVRQVGTITRGSDAPSRISRPSRPGELTPGDSIDDFDLARRLGEGAFAVVFLAYQRSMMRRVALKVSHHGRDEPPTLGQLDHPNIVRVYGVTHLDDRQLQLMCMEYLSGGTLREVVAAIDRSGGPPDTDGLFFETVNKSLADGDDQPLKAGDNVPWTHHVCNLGAQLADALSHAHSKRILHRDIKPANVLLSSTGTPKLADFNIAFGEHVSETSAAGNFGGTLAYMSPEQLEACRDKSGVTPEDVDHRSDIYSLAIVLWELLSGQKPFNESMRDFVSSEPTKKCRRDLSDEAIRSLPVAKCPGLRDVLRRCLEVRPEARYQTADELARDLRLCTKPRVQSLMSPPASKTMRWIYRHPLLATILVSLLPNLLISSANVLYDWHALVRPLQAEEQFLPVMLWGKVALYSMGVVFGVWKTAPMFWAMRARSSLAAVKAARYSCLTLADLVFGITISTWFASGFLFPLLTNLRGANLGQSHYLIFLTSHVLCGLIAGNLVVFSLAYLAVRVFYPRLLTGDLEPGRLKRAHQRLQRRLEVYFMVAVSVPFISALALGMSLSNTGTEYWPAFLVLGLLGALVLVLGSAAKGETRKNLEALDEFVVLSTTSS